METEIDWQLLIPILIVAVVLVVYLVIRNQKDEKEYEKSENVVKPEPEEEDSY